MRPLHRDEITITFDPFSLSPVMRNDLARAVLDAQLRLAQAVMVAAWEAQSGFLRATAAAVLDAQGRVAASLLRGSR